MYFKCHYLQTFVEFISLLLVMETLGPGTAEHLNSEATIEKYLPISILGLRVEEGYKDVAYNDGILQIPADTIVRLRLFGHGLTNHTIIRFVSELGEFGSNCGDLTSTRTFQLEPEVEPFLDSAVSEIILPPLDYLIGQKVYYLCIRENNTDVPWIHQGINKLLMLQTHTSLLPLWSLILGIVILLLFAAVFSGLNLGLMALDQTELKIIAATGTTKEKRYAKLIQPLRNRGNYLLCTLLLGNVMVNSTLTILLDEISTGVIAIVGATLSIVILGEIVPQAICSRHGLAIGARTVWLTKFFMLITFPIAYPISVVLDKALGEEIGNVYNRARLIELLKITHGYNDLENYEENIIAGALELKKKMVVDVMTKLESIFMLPIEAVLDFNTISDIMTMGYSRIPVFDKFPNNIVSILYTKDLAFVDPDDRMPLKAICEFRNNPVMFVSETTKLDVMFRNFKKGHMGHMSIVQTKNGIEAIGLVTLEDIIEELIQADIKDEMDISRAVTKSRRKSRSLFSVVFSPEASRWKRDGVVISSQLAQAAFQFLCTSVPGFGDENISKIKLQTLLNQELFFEIKTKNRTIDNSDLNTIIYEKGIPADFFVLILEGRVRSEVGKEKLIFESGPFSFYGVQCLAEYDDGTSDTQQLDGDPEIEKSCKKFIPDYTVRAISDVTFLRIPRSIYIEARKTTAGDCNSSTDLIHTTDLTMNHTISNSPLYHPHPKIGALMDRIILRSSSIQSEIDFDNNNRNNDITKNLQDVNRV